MNYFWAIIIQVPSTIIFLPSYCPHLELVQKEKVHQVDKKTAFLCYFSNSTGYRSNCKMHVVLYHSSSAVFKGYIWHFKSFKYFLRKILQNNTKKKKKREKVFVHFLLSDFSLYKYYINLLLDENIRQFYETVIQWLMKNVWVLLRLYVV